MDTLSIYEDAHLVLPPGTLIHFGNHSCDPNMWHVGPFEIATRRAVDVGEELTIDYGTPSGVAGFSMACSCGLRSVVAWSQAMTGASLLSGRGTGITGFRLWKPESRTTSLGSLGAHDAGRWRPHS